MERDHDQALLERIRQGDRAAFEMLVVRYQGPIYNAAYRVLGKAEDAADIAQVVFLRIAERLDDVVAIAPRVLERKRAPPAG